MKLHPRTSLLVFLFVLFMPMLKSQSTSDEVVFTAPLSYSSRFVGATRSLGISAQSIPVISTDIDSASSETKALVSAPDRYDYVIFCSRKAVDAYAYYETSAHAHGKTATQYLAIGKDVDYLRERTGLDVAFLSHEASPLGLVAALKSRHITNKKVTVLAPGMRGIEEPFVVPQFIAALQETGLEVTRIDAYYTRPVTSNVNALIRLLEDGKVSLLAFTSGGEIEALMTGIAHSGKDTAKLLQSVPVACFGPYTRRCAFKYRLDVKVVATDFSRAEGFAEAISHYIRSR